MKAVILAGGYGTRLSEETGVKPKPMVEIGEQPILWHIMQRYARHGVNEFVICCGYKGYVIKKYFSEYCLRSSDVTFDFARNNVHYHGSRAEPWKVTLVDTGESTMTGGRLRRVRAHLGDEPFFFTYGDGLSDVDLDALVAYHRQQGALATLTAVQPPGRFGTFVLSEQDTHIDQFREKPQREGAWINGGFFVLEPAVLDYIEGDHTVWEREPMEQLATEGNLAAYRHTGFWHPMDTLRDKNYLQELWEGGQAPWSLA